MEAGLEEIAASLAAAEGRADAAQARANEAWSSVAGLLQGPKADLRDLWSSSTGH